MQDGTRPPFDHAGQQGPVEADGGHQIEVQFPDPFHIVQRGEPAGRGGGSADDVDDQIDAAEMIENALRNGGASPGCVMSAARK